MSHARRGDTHACSEGRVVFFSFFLFGGSSEIHRSAEGWKAGEGGAALLVFFFLRLLLFRIKSQLSLGLFVCLFVFFSSRRIFHFHSNSFIFFFLRYFIRVCGFAGGVCGGGLRVCGGGVVGEGTCFPVSQKTKRNNHTSNKARTPPEILREGGGEGGRQEGEKTVKDNLYCPRGGEGGGGGREEKEESGGRRRRRCEEIRGGGSETVWVCGVGGWAGVCVVVRQEWYSVKGVAGVGRRGGGGGWGRTGKAEARGGEGQSTWVQSLGGGGGGGCGGRETTCACMRPHATHRPFWLCMCVGSE